MRKQHCPHELRKQKQFYHFCWKKYCNEKEGKRFFAWFWVYMLSFWVLKCKVIYFRSISDLFHGKCVFLSIASELKAKMIRLCICHGKLLQRRPFNPQLWTQTKLLWAFSTFAMRLNHNMPDDDKNSQHLWTFNWFPPAGNKHNLLTHIQGKHRSWAARVQELSLSLPTHGVNSSV